MPNPIKRGNSWQVKIRRKGRDGILEKVNETFDTHAEAQRFIELKLGASARHERMSRDKEANTSLRMLLDRYEQEVVDPKPAKPRAQQRSIMTKWRNSGLADHSLLALEPELFGRWRDKQTKAGAAGSTVANAMNTLSGVFRRAKTEWGFKFTNPLSELSRPRAAEPREVFLSDVQEKLVIAECEKGPPQLVWAVRIALATAMRASEIRGLKWEHVNHKTAVVRLNKTKNGERRDVPVLKTALAIFSAAREKLPVRDDGFIFGDPDKPGSEGGYTATMLTASFANAAERAKLPELRFHDLRHVATTRLAEVHRDAMDLAKTTGHKTLGMLARYYNEPAEDRAARLEAKAAELRRKARRSGTATQDRR